MLGNSIALIAVAVMLGLEAYKTSERLPRIVLTALAVAFALSGMLINQIAEASPLIGSFVTSIFSRPSSWFILSMGLFFVLRQFWQAAPGTLENGAGYDDSELRLKVGEVHSQGRHIIERLDAIDREIEGSKLIGGPKAELDGKIAEIRGKLDTVLRNDSLTSAETARRFSDLGKRFDGIYYSLVAIEHRERMLALAEAIDERGQSLFDAVEVGHKALSQEEWDAWQVSEGLWRNAIAEWVGIASFYFPNAQTEIERPDKHIYEKGQWQFREDQFPTSESDAHQRSNAVHRYKTFRIARGRWEDTAPKAHDFARQVAFERYTPPHWK